MPLPPMALSREDGAMELGRAGVAHVRWMTLCMTMNVHVHVHVHVAQFRSTTCPFTTRRHPFVSLSACRREHGRTESLPMALRAYIHLLSYCSPS